MGAPCLPPYAAARAGSGPGPRFTGWSSAARRQPSSLLASVAALYEPQPVVKSQPDAAE